MKSFLLFTLSLLLFVLPQTQAQQTLFQGFEGTLTDNFPYNASPARYNNQAAEDVWSDTTATTQISPATGNRLWFMRDLENPSGGGAFEHTLDFGPVDVSAFSSNTLSFKYFTIAYDSDDSVGYYVAYDNGTNWTNYTALQPNTQAWETVTINVPPGAAFVRLRLAARQNGGSDFAAWDDIQLVSAQADMIPPTVISATLNGPNTLQVIFSEAMGASAANPDNYTGIAGLLAATTGSNGDTVLLNYATPFEVGNSYSLTIDSVQDLAGNYIAAPFVFNFTVPAPLISFSSARVRVEENAGIINVPVKIDNFFISQATAKVRVVEFSTATEGSHFDLLDSTVIFVNGSANSLNVRVNILDNTEQRDSRYIILQLYDFNGAQSGTVFEFVVLISDNDTPAPLPQGNAVIALRHLTSYDIDPASSATAEISAFDPLSKRLFTTNIEQNKLEIIDLKNPYALSKITSVDITAYGGGINSVAVANNVVAVAVDDTLITNPGKIVFFDVAGTFLNAVTVGALPDHVNFTPDGSRLLVANEGEPATDYSVDPEGSVSVIDMTPGVAALTQANVTTIGFTQFNADSAALVSAGVRIFGPGATVAQDLEPEYVTVSDDGLTAWVTLQENNALAVIDLTTNTVGNIIPLGLKDYAAQKFALDASDQAPGIFFNNWKVKGIYQPDAIAYWNVGGNGFLVTANEGDVREWNAYAEITRLGASGYVLDSASFPDAAYLKRAELLGRLNVSTAGGDTDGDGDYDEIHTFGGRSISIWNAATGALVWDSGDDIERITAADPVFGSIFNASNSNNTRKNRSDDKGPEPEGITLGTIDGRNYAFTALERIGGVMVYDVTNPVAPEYVQWINTRATGSAAGGDLGPEGILFIPKAESPNQRDLLVVSNEISGTISVFEINIDRTKTNEFGVTKYAFDDTPVIGQANGADIREGGISGLMYRDGRYRMISDRGPNADANAHPNANGATTLVFPFPDYAPKVWEVTPVGTTLEVNSLDFVKRPDASGVTGLPLPVGAGNTGEIAWADTSGAVLENDIWGLDSEGIAQDNEGNYWICDEYGTSVWQLDEQFKVKKRFTPFATQAEDIAIDSTYGKRRPNRGFEGVAYTPNGKIYAILQSPSSNPNLTVGNATRLHRILEIDPASGTFKTFVYEHDPVLGEIRSRDWKIGDLTAINNEEFLVLEHAERNGWNAKNIYKFSLAGATPVTTDNFNGLTLEQLDNAVNAAAAGVQVVQKELFLDLLELGWERQHDKPEGLAIVNDSTLAVINDNDFGIASPNADGSLVLTGKTTRLYEYRLPTAKHVNYINPYCKVDLGDDFVACGPLDYYVELSSQGFAQTLWSDGNADLNRIFTEPGIYGVTAITSFGCTSRDTVVLGQSDFPSVDLGADQALCPNDTLTLNAGVFITYLWNTGDTTQSIVVENAGGYSVSVTNEFGCEGTGFIFITSAQNPVVNLGPNQNLCAGQTLLLDAGNTGATYNWSNGESTQSIEVNTGGAYTVTVINSDGCVASDAITLINAATPVINLGADQALCEGGSATFNTGYPGAATIWSTGATTPSITVTESGVYSVQVTLVTGCSDTDTVELQVNPVPTVELGADTTICEGQTLGLDAGNTGATYSWSNGATSQDISVGTESVYAVTVTNTFGCTATDDILVEVEICIGVAEKDWAAGVRVYPNPSAGLLTLDWTMMPEQETNISVLNTWGQMMLAPQIIVAPQTQLDLGQLPKGMYLIRMQQGTQVRNLPVVLQ